MKEETTIKEKSKFKNIIEKVLSPTIGAGIGLAAGSLLFSTSALFFMGETLISTIGALATGTCFAFINEKKLFPENRKKYLAGYVVGAATAIAIGTEIIVASVLGNIIYKQFNPENTEEKKESLIYTRALDTNSDLQNKERISLHFTENADGSRTPVVYIADNKNELTTQPVQPFLTS